MDGIDDVIEDIRAREEAKKAEAERVRKQSGSTLFANGLAVEEDLVQDIPPAALDEVTVAGVDGGVVRKEFHGIDIIMLRAVGAVFTYENGALEAAAYEPEKNPTPRIEYVTRNLPRNSVDRLTGLYRLRAEIEAAQALVDDADLILLDGSLVPQYPDKPGEEDGLRGEYEAVVDAYTALYEAVEEGNTMLAGVVEDTRSTDICGILQENGFDSDVIRQCRDSHLLSYLLEAGERTLLMGYGDTEQHPILTDLGDYSDHIYSSYVRAAKHDRPVRVDILAPDDRSAVADTITSHVYTLAGVNDTYGVPAPLIEADQRAKLEGHEVDLVTKRIQAKLAHLSGVEELRRERRPF